MGVGVRERKRESELVVSRENRIIWKLIPAVQVEKLGTKGYKKQISVWIAHMLNIFCGSEGFFW